jgi:N-methylhydantoinase A
MGYRLGVDVGGTFTDLLLFNVDTGGFAIKRRPRRMTVPKGY